MKKTKWFSGKTSPLRPGIYEAYDAELEQAFFCFWDGKLWHYGWGEDSLGDPNANWNNKPWLSFDKQRDQWRGLTTKDGK